MGFNKYKKASSAKSDIRTILISFLIAAMFFTALTPVAFAAQSGQVTITFDPSGTVDLDIDPDTLNFGAITIGGAETHVSPITIFNNGTATMDTWATGSNATNLVLNFSGVAPTGERFSMAAVNGTCDLCSGSSVIDVGGIQLHNDTTVSGSNTFYVEVALSGTATDHGAQTAHINLTAYVST